MGTAGAGQLNEGRRAVGPFFFRGSSRRDEGLLHLPDLFPENAVRSGLTGALRFMVRVGEDTYACLLCKVDGRDKYHVVCGSSKNILTTIESHCRSHGHTVFMTSAAANAGSGGGSSAQVRRDKKNAQAAEGSTSLLSVFCASGAAAAAAEERRRDVGRNIVRSIKISKAIALFAAETCTSFHAAGGSAMTELLLAASGIPGLTPADIPGRMGVRATAIKLAAEGMEAFGAAWVRLLSSLCRKE